MAERFYVNSPLAPGPVVLQGPEARHLSTVCRLRPGDLVCLFNGDGKECPAVVVSTARHTVAVDVVAVESPERELPFRVEVAAPLPKGDRAQFLLEKLTELGVASFVPLRTRRSVVHPGDNRLEKLQRYVIEASKQCGRNVLLRVGQPTDWDEYCRRAGPACSRVLAQFGGTDRYEVARQDVVLAVGPEGGWTEEEVALARTEGWRLVDLGPRTLRVETAALALVAWAVLPP